MNKKPSIWAYCITTSHAFFEGNIKTPHQAPAIAEFMGIATDTELLAKDIHDKLLSTIDNPVKSNGNLVDTLTTKFPTITTILAGYSKDAGAYVALLINKNDKLYSLVVLGIETEVELSPITSKIINHHLL